MLVELLMAAAVSQNEVPPRREPPPAPMPAGGQGASAERGGQPKTVPALPEIKNVFLLGFDANRDGFLSLGELPRRFARRFAAADVNGDGVLDAAEILHDRGPIGKEEAVEMLQNVKRAGEVIYRIAR